MKCNCGEHRYSRKNRLIFDGDADMEVSIPHYNEDQVISCLALSKHKIVKITCDDNVRQQIIDHFGYCL